MMGKDKVLCLDIAGLKVKINTNHTKYYDYLRLYFDQIILSQNAKQDFNIEINAYWQDVTWGKYIKGLKKSNNFAQIGANTLINGNNITTIRKVERKKKIIFDFKTEDRKLSLAAITRWKAFKDTIRYRILGKPQEDWFFSLTFPILYYPVFWYLEYFMHTHMLHASAVEFQGEGVVICGLEGTGKTSLALSLLQDPQTSFLSDNLVAYDSYKIYPCYELIRLHQDENSFLWDKKFRKVNRFNSLKDFYKPAFELRKEGAKPGIFVFPEFSSKFSVKEIAGPEAVHRAIILSQLPAELGNYDEFRKLYNFLDLKFNPQESQCKVLSDLLSSARCYIVGMPKADGLKINSERFKGFIKNG